MRLPFIKEKLLDEHWDSYTTNTKRVAVEVRRTQNHKVKKLTVHNIIHTHYTIKKFKNKKTIL